MKKLVCLLMIIPMMVFAQTRNIVPNNTGEGKLGTPLKHWGSVNADTVRIGGRDLGSAVFTDSTKYLVPSDTTLLHEQIAGKAASVHGHAQGEVTALSDSIGAKPTREELTTLLGGKAAVSHAHAQSEVTGLPDSVGAKPTRDEITTLLSTKAATSHSHTQSEVTGLTDSVGAKPTRTEATTLLSGKANTSHTQNISTVIGAQDSLTNKLNRTEATTLLGTKADVSHNQAISTVTGAQDSLTAKLNRIEATTLLATKIGVVGYSVGDTAAFTTTATRAAVYIVGCRDNQIWDASPRRAANTGLPVAGDLLDASPKWDSLIVKRAAGTTSGLKFNYFRVK